MNDWNIKAIILKIKDFLLVIWCELLECKTKNNVVKIFSCQIKVKKVRLSMIKIARDLDELYYRNKAFLHREEVDRPLFKNALFL